MMIKDVIGVYQTTKGENVKGVITAKAERTMTVRDAKSVMHQCWIPKEEKTKKRKRSRRDTSVKCYSISPDGQKREFESMAEAAKEYNVSAALVSRVCRTGDAIVKGEFAGYKFSRAERLNERQKDN